MEYILIQVFAHELLGIEKLEYDLFNSRGEIIGKKNQKVDPGFLLMIKYLKVFKRDYNAAHNNENDPEKQKIIDFTRQLLLLGIKKGASKIDIEPRKNDLQIILNLDGNKQEKSSLDKSVYLPLSKKLQDYARVNIDDKKNHEGDFIISIFNRSIRIKFTSSPTDFGNKITLDIFDERKNIIPEINELFFFNSAFNKLKEALGASRGIFIIAGAQDSGKTATLYSIIKYLKNPETTVSVIENSNKYYLPEVDQILVDPVHRQSLISILKNSLKHSSDILAIEDIQNRDVINILCEAAVNGQFILATINAKNSFEVISSFYKTGVHPSIVASSIIGILSQKPVKKICDYCKEEYIPSSEEINRNFIQDSETEVLFYRGKGCQKCNNTGYFGQIPLYELLVFDENLQSLITNEEHSREIVNYINKIVPDNIKYDGLKKVLCGHTTIKEVDKITL